MAHKIYPHEQLVSRQAFEPFPLQRIISRQEVLEELARPCSRFRSPTSWDDAMRTRVAEVSRAFGEFRGIEPLALVGGIPLNWMRLLEYLRENSVTDSMRFAFSSFFADGPKTYATRIDRSRGSE